MADKAYTDPRDHPGKTIIIIIIESMFSSISIQMHFFHKGIMELAPEGADLETKSYINRIECDDDDSEEQYIGLRFSRVNHSCQPNADYVLDEATGVIILFALKNIQCGDEICINYWPFVDLDFNRKTAKLSPEEEFASVQNYLANRYGIICPEDCYCRDSNARRLVLEGRKFHTEMSVLVGRGRIEEALEFGEKLLGIHRLLNVSIVEQFETEYHCYQIAKLGGETLESRAKKYLQNVHDFHNRVCKYSEFTKTCKSLLMQYPEMK